MAGPTPGRRRGAAWAARLAWLAMLIPPARAQGPEAGEGAGRAARLGEMAALLRDVRVVDPAHADRTPLPLRPEPLHRWSDPTRELSDGALWAFGKSGRPLALATMEIYAGTPGSGPLWACELISAAPGALAAEAGWSPYIPPERPQPDPPPTLKWTPKGPGVAFDPLPGPPAPAVAEAERLRQMKAIAARFSAYQAVTDAAGAETRYELRLLPRPAHRYADPDAGIVDGAIFLLAYGTNPELLLFIEAREPPEAGRPATWSHGCARLSTARLSVRLDGREIWARPFAREPDPGEPYYFIRAARPAMK